jgi:hypothetical protein
VVLLLVALAAAVQVLGPLVQLAGCLMLLVLLRVLLLLWEALGGPLQGVTWVTPAWCLSAAVTLLWNRCC